MSSPSVDDLSGTTGIVALAAAGVALVALILAMVLAFRLGTVRNAQRAVFGELGTQDLVTHAADITEQFRGLHEWVDDVAAKLHDRIDAAEHRLDGAIAIACVIAGERTTR